MNYFIIIWIAAGFVGAVCSYGITLGYFQREYPELAQKGYRGDVGIATFQAVMTLLCPLAILVPIMCSGFAEHGLQFRRKQ